MGHPYPVRGWGLLIASGTGLAAYMIGTGGWPSVVAEQVSVPTAMPTLAPTGKPSQTPGGATPGPTPSEISVAGTTTISQTSVSLVHDIALAIIAAGATLLPAGAAGYAAARRVPPTPQAPQAPLVPQAPEPPQTPPRKPPA
jgi:hypothetical protein